ncbi:MAG: hypothetical protein K0B07_04235 [DPANN group archaeon]|nr:hypothetical protein [DPANN group archaeon]
MAVTITFEKKHFLIAGLIIAIPFLLIAISNIFAATTMPAVGHSISELFVNDDFDLNGNKIIGSGNITITGSGNGIIFSDNTIQTSAINEELIIQSVSFDISYPDGHNNIIPITVSNLDTTRYTVPAGKNLYITNPQIMGTNRLYIDNKAILYGTFNMEGLSLAQPIIVGEGQNVTANVFTVVINGFLVDSTVVPITVSNLDTARYTVPAGKNLYITSTHILGNRNRIYIDDKAILYGTFNMEGLSLAQPIIVGEGQNVTANVFTVVINGYLRDI